jgi:uncharacterized membrane protein YfcA
MDTTTGERVTELQTPTGDLFCVAIGRPDHLRVLGPFQWSRVLSHDFTTVLILFGVGIVSGTINVIAGGGSMITLPVLILLGLPPNVANGTNRVAILAQNVGATWSFHRLGLISGPWLRLAVPPALVGALLGTWAALNIGDLAFQRILALVLVLAAGWIVWRPMAPGVEPNRLPPEGKKRWLLILLFSGLGFYGGFIQAGMGFIALAVTTGFGLDLIRSNAVKVTLVLAFTPLALGIFAYNGRVDWLTGFVLAGGTFLGALIGVRLQVLKGQKWVRGVLTATVVVFAIRLLVAG